MVSETQNLLKRYIVKKTLFFFSFVLILSGGILAQSQDKRDIVTPYPVINDALRLQQNAISSPLYAEIFTELETTGAITWKTNTLVSNPLNNRQSYSSNTEWLLANYNEKGMAEANNLSFYKSFWRKSKTTAKVKTCSSTVKINIRKINGSRDKFSWANTLLHERIHSFCLQHTGGQTRPANMCDMAYIVGDLAEAVLIAQTEGTATKSYPNVCPALCEALSARDITYCN